MPYRNSQFVIRLAVILTCHNRRDTSVRSVAEVLRQTPDDCDLRVFAVDDGSSDGTAEALSKLDARVQVIPGPGNLFWAGGMRLASEQAVKWGSDWYMWLNDDLQVGADALKAFKDSAHVTHPERASIIVGDIYDPDTMQVTYGARSWSAETPLAFPLAHRSVSQIDTFNGNPVFFSAEAYARVGGFPSHYRHGFADFVMGLRASRSGVAILRLPTVAGFDRLNVTTSQLFDPSVSLARRLRLVFSPFGLPVIDYLRFCVEVNGFRAGLYWYLRTYYRVIMLSRRVVHTSS